MYGYNRVADNTHPNVMALLTGQLAEERPSGAIDLAPFLWKDFSANGYRTIYVEDTYTENHIFSVGVNMTYSHRGFRSVPTDYYFRPLSVAMSADHSLLDWRPKSRRLCTGPKLEHELLLNWVSSSGLLLFLPRDACSYASAVLGVVILSVRLPVCPSVRLSVCHTRAL